MKKMLAMMAVLVAICGTVFGSGPAEKRNVILMISDGIGFNGWLAADYYQGMAGRQSYQLPRPDGTTPQFFGAAHWSLNLVDAEGRLLPNKTPPELAAGVVEQGYDPATRWTKFENAFLNDFSPEGKSYTSYTDSAAAGTTLHTGRKTANGRLNMDWTGGRSFTSIAETAMKQGRAAGAVSSVQVSHATPASVLAHNVSRSNYADIFVEMVNSDLSVIMGAGHPFFDESGNPVQPAVDDDKAFQYLGGRETAVALTGPGGLNGFTFIDDKADFEALARGERLPKKVVGIARAHTTLQAERADLPEAETPSGMAFNAGVPDLRTMALGALNVLDVNPKGFFLMVEGGAVDWMGHANNMPRYIEEQIDFNAAVAAVIDWVEQHSSWEETLLIVTSDHECGGIWGEGTYINSEGGGIATNRTDAAINAARYDPSEDQFVAFNAVQDRGKGRMPGYQFASGNHTNELVPMWALGSGSEFFAQFGRTDLGAARLWSKPYRWDGTFLDNTAIYHVMNLAIVDR